MKKCNIKNETQKLQTKVFGVLGHIGGQVVDYGVQGFPLEVHPQQAICRTTHSNNMTTTRHNNKTTLYKTSYKTSNNTKTSNNIKHQIKRNGMPPLLIAFLYSAPKAHVHFISFICPFLLSISLFRLAGGHLLIFPCLCHSVLLCFCDSVMSHIVVLSYISQSTSLFALSVFCITSLSLSIYSS